MWIDRARQRTQPVRCSALMLGHEGHQKENVLPQKFRSTKGLDPLYFRYNKACIQMHACIHSLSLSLSLTTNFLTQKEERKCLEGITCKLENKLK